MGPKPFISPTILSHSPSLPLSTLTPTCSCSPPCRAGSFPASKPRPTELPIHFCGTGDRRQATAKPHSWRQASWHTISASSVQQSLFGSSPRATSDLGQKRRRDGVVISFLHDLRGLSRPFEGFLKDSSRPFSQATAPGADPANEAGSRQRASAAA